MPRIRARTIAEHKELTRRQLIDAALAMFVADGFGATSFTEIAAIAGVGRTTLYEYYPSKDDLMVAVAEAEVPPVLHRAIEALPDGGSVERLEHLYRAMFEAAVAHPDVAILLFRVAREAPSTTRRRVWETVSPITDEIRRVCVAGLAAGEMAADCPECLAQSVRDLLVGGLRQMLALRDRVGAGGTLDTDALLKDRLRFLRSGVAV